MGTLNVEVIVRNLDARERSHALSLAVDTGATHTILPARVIDALGIHPTGTARVRLANGSVDEWPATAVLMRLEEKEWPTIALVGPSDGPALLGAVTLEEFRLAVDPVARRLIPADAASV